MIEEHCNVVLTQDIDAAGLRAGDIGTVVMVHAKGAAYEVEFMTLGEQTLAVLTLSSEQIRPVDPGEIAHVRQVA
jgi:hypothetical protein